MHSHANWSRSSDHIDAPARGQMKRPSCNRRTASHVPCASQHSTLMRVAARLRPLLRILRPRHLHIHVLQNTYALPSNGYWPSVCCTWTSNRSIPQRRSTGSVTSHQPLGLSMTIAPGSSAPIGQDPGRSAEPPAARWAGGLRCGHPSPAHRRPRSAPPRALMPIPKHALASVPTSDASTRSNSGSSRAGGNTPPASGRCRANHPGVASTMPL